MTEIAERTLALLREGTLPVMLPLVLVCILMWILIVERVNVLFGPVWLLVWPPARQKIRQLKAALADAFDAYLTRPTETNRRMLRSRCQRLFTPYSRFLLAAVGRGDREPADLRELRILKASHDAETGIEKSLLMISTFAKAAPLLGLLGTVTGMIQTFRIMMLASTSDPRALSSGISIALIATEVGLVVSLSGVIGSSWLNRRAQVLEEEIRLASMRISQTEEDSSAYRNNGRP